MDQEVAPGKKVLDLSCGSGVTSETLAKLGFRVTATDYSLLFHYGFEMVELRATRVKFASRLFLWLFWPWMWISSLVAVIHAEKDPIQRRYNWQILSYLFHPSLLLSDTIVVKARKADEDSPSA